MKTTKKITLNLVFLFFIVNTYVLAQNRYALVIGNNNYEKISKLENPVNDATDIAAKLRTLGYQVELQTNIGKVAMDRAIFNYMQRLAGSRENEGFFWFAGHGIQIDGENFLLPIDVDDTDDLSVRHTSYSVKLLTQSFDSRARNKVNIVVLDACRNNPFRNSGGTRSLSRGLSVIKDNELPSDLFIIYSTAADTVAQDGTGKRNSPFAEAFMKNMDSSEDISIAVRGITMDTLRLTNNTQRPFTGGSIISLNYYSLKSGSIRPASPVTPSPAPQQYDDEKDFKFISDSKNGVIVTEYIGSKKEVRIPPKIQNYFVTGISYGAFADNQNITIVTIPNSVKKIENDAFWDCTSLIAINVDVQNTTYSSTDGVLYNKNKTILLKYPDGKQGAFTIPNNVTSISDLAFLRSSLTSIIIPDSVTNMGSGTFCGCKKLARVTIGNGVTSIDGIGAGGGGYGAFLGCTSLTSVTIPNSVKSIGFAAFEACTSLTSITIPNSVTSIEQSAFTGCTNLTSITFQGTISSKDFDDDTFDGDLRAKYLARDGGPGTYRRLAGGNTWRKQ